MTGDDLNVITRPLDFLEQTMKEAGTEAARRNQLLSYWCKLFENLSYSPQGFYALVEKNLAWRQVPELEKSYLLLHEGSFFSKRRLYFSMRRQRLVFEICAAPFGTGFFVSSRLFDRRREASFLHYVVALLLLNAIVAWITRDYGWVAGLVVFGLLFTGIWSLMRLAASNLAVWLDNTLSLVPCIGPIYESLFHPDTYYRQDQNNMYREAVHNAVMQSVGEMTAEKGLKPLTELESRPILRDLHLR